MESDNRTTYVVLFTLCLIAAFFTGMWVGDTVLTHAESDQNAN